jgi:hypothetical protein
LAAPLPRTAAANLTHQQVAGESLFELSRNPRCFMRATCCLAFI